MDAGGLLTIVGGGFEVAGLALVAVEIRRDRDLAAEYLAALEVAPPFIGPRSPSPQEMTMRDVDRAMMRPEDHLRNVQAESETKFQQVGTQTARAVAQQRSQFHAFIRDLLQGGLGQRVTGAVLIGVGIVTSTAGNVV